jgi:Cd2+/Zn2+-exporting ATPase/Cu+-exporting ATPase
MAKNKTLEVPVGGMDCADCARHVQKAVSDLPGVESVTVLLSSEKAVVKLAPGQADLSDIQKAVRKAGYTVPDPAAPQTASLDDFNRRVGILLILVFAVVLFMVIAGELLGLFDVLNTRIPFTIGLVLVILGGWPVFKNVAQAAYHRQITSHTLMTVGVIAALVIGEWVTAAIVVTFMRVGDYVERFTTERARRALKELSALAPQTARVQRAGEEMEIPVQEVKAGETVIVRPGEKIPVDGVVIAGRATVDQSAITGESMPVEMEVGSEVYAAAMATLGSLRIETHRTGSETTFGRVVKMVEEAEAHRGDMQRYADQFSAFYLPVVGFIASVTFLLSRDPLSTAAVLVVACSCSFALATPVAMLASIGRSAKHGLLIKGGKYLESLARADVLLIDKTGTVTLGKPQVTDVFSFSDEMSEMDVLALAAAVERDSEHPLAEAVRRAALNEGLSLTEPQRFESVPGLGVRARVDGKIVAVGSRRFVQTEERLKAARKLEAQGKTLLYLTREGELLGIIAAADTLRSEIPTALAELEALGIKQIELLTGDNERTASAIADELGIGFRAELLPEDKINVVESYQAEGRTVVMIGDGVNDAPALAQANIGIAMGAAGTDIAMEAAHVSLMREDWMLIPEGIRTARRTMRVVKMNLGFTALYNVIGLSLAALGYLPPALAAAAQSLPDLGIMANSARLMRKK